MPPPPPTIDDVIDAARRLRGYAVTTPLLHSESLDRLTGGRILVKAECLQRTGSFKFRGAFNRISRLPQRGAGARVVAWSSGNHAQGVAAAARLLGAKATIVMPADAPAIKIARTRADGAEVVLYDRDTQSREEIGAAIAEETGAAIVRPYDDPDIIAGQGTVGLEAAAQAAAMGLVPEAALVPCGGGGLISGTGLALTHHLPGLPVFAVEPAGFDDTARSLAAGDRQANEPGGRSICDALLASIPGALTFALNRKLLAGGLSVTDDQALAAMRIAFEHLKVVLEPGGAVALAAALADGFDCRDKTVLVVASGGNVDPDMFERALSGEARSTP